MLPACYNAGIYFYLNRAHCKLKNKDRQYGHQKNEGLHAH